MTLAIELTARAIRIAAVDDGRITALTSFPLAIGQDAIQALAAAQLPRNAGRDVIVLLHHDEMLVRLLTQPPCPRDRLDMLVEFELTGGGEDGAEAVAADWHVVPGFGIGDIRILGMAVKRALIDRLRQALATHGLHLAGLSHPAVALYRSWRSCGGLGDAVLVDVGATVTHLAIVRGDELCLLRTLPVGMDALVEQVADLRGMPRAEAATLVARLRASSPEDLLELVKRQGGAVAAAISGTLKFARAQLQIDDWKPAALVMAGAGAQVHGFGEAVAERVGFPARMLNPFVGLESGLPAEEMDAKSALPSPWTAVIGAAATKKLELDAIADDRRHRNRFWVTDGILRAGVALAAACILGALVWQEVAIVRAGSDIDRLGGPQGLVTQAQKQLSEVSALQKHQSEAMAKVAWLDAEHRSGRVASELLVAIASVQHPERCPVVLERYRTERTPGQIRVELEGYARSAGAKRTSDVLHSFEEGLRAGYPPIASVESRPQPIERDRQRFFFVLTVPDRKAP